MSDRERLSVHQKKCYTTTTTIRECFNLNSQRKRPRVNPIKINRHHLIKTRLNFVSVHFFEPYFLFVVNNVLMCVQTWPPYCYTFSPLVTFHQPFYFSSVFSSQNQSIKNTNNIFLVKQFLQEAKEEFLKKWESPQKVSQVDFYVEFIRLCR